MCARCHPITKLCVQCEKDIYIPDSKGGCENSKKCVFGKNHCVECLEDDPSCKYSVEYKLLINPKIIPKNVT